MAQLQHGEGVRRPRALRTSSVTSGCGSRRSLDQAAEARPPSSSAPGRRRSGSSAPSRPVSRGSCGGSSRLATATGRQRVVDLLGDLRGRSRGRVAACVGLLALALEVRRARCRPPSLAARSRRLARRRAAAIDLHAPLAPALDPVERCRRARRATRSSRRRTPSSSRQIVTSRNGATVRRARRRARTTSSWVRATFSSQQVLEVLRAARSSPNSSRSTSQTTACRPSCSHDLERRTVQAGLSPRGRRRRGPRPTANR